MKGRVIKVTLTFSVLLIIATVLLLYGKMMESPQDIRSEQLLDTNEISELIKKGDIDLAQEKLEIYQDSLRQSPLEESIGYSGIIMCALTIFFMAMVFLYVYINILRPFDKMKDFASEIAKGNFDVPLDYERSNYFGAFTWAFDSMRKEITRARTAEHEAIENNKTVIATLSHDIKTPITSIRAYAEGLEASLDKSPERRQRYLEVLMRKCDEVTELTNDLFLHSLSDMGKIEIRPESFELVSYIEQLVSELTAERGDVTFRRPDFSSIVSLDKKRTSQIVENLINNSRKYAKTDITISMNEIGDSNQDVQIHFIDKGNGIPDEDMPFIREKFYRGHNAGEEDGSGLGLYIVDYIVKQSGGSFELINRHPGLEAIVTLPVQK